MAVALVLVSAMITATLALICTKAGKPPGIGIGILNENGIFKMTLSEDSALVGLPAVNERPSSPTKPLLFTDAEVVAPPAIAMSAFVRNLFTNPLAVAWSSMPLFFLVISRSTSSLPGVGLNVSFN